MGPVDTIYLGLIPRRHLVVVESLDEPLHRNQHHELNRRLGLAGGAVRLEPSLGTINRSGARSVRGHASTSAVAAGSHCAVSTSEVVTPAALPPCR